MPNTDLWPEGRAPDRSELLQYLVHTLGLRTEDARQVANRYREPSAQSDQPVPLGGGEWNAERLRLWLNAQPEVRDVQGPAGITAALGGEAGHTARGALAGDPGVLRRGGSDGDFTATREQREADRLAQAEAEADRAVGRAGRTRDRFYRHAAAVGFDSGPAFDPAAMAQSLAVGVFTDAAGNPQIDPETGLPVEVTPQSLWQAIKGQTFDMGTLAIPRAGRDPRRGARAGREGADDARLARLEAVTRERRQFMTPSMAMALLGSMDDDGVIKIQQQLWEAGLFGENPPSWGVADDATRKAYMALFAEASLTPDDPIDRVLARLTDEAITRGTAGGETEGERVPAFKPEIASAESIKAMVDDIAQDLVGRFATDEEKGRLVERLQAREIETQRAAYERDVAELSGGRGGPAGGIDAFMAAISGLESGGSYTAENPSGAYGKFQIMPANWGPWAERAGIGRNAPRTPRNQEIVARHVMIEYYQRFGNWRDVAIAWFAGPGAVGAAGAERRSDGNMTVREYADSIMSRMADVGGAPTATGGGQSFEPIETFDPQAEAEAALKAMDPVGWQGHQFASRAPEFFSLLAGVA